MNAPSAEMRRPAGGPLRGGIVKKKNAVPPARRRSGRIGLAFATAVAEAMSGACRGGAGSNMIGVRPGAVIPPAAVGSQRRRGAAARIALIPPAVSNVPAF